jgi:hypothetical protein
LWQKTPLKDADVVQWELKNKRTGKLYWLSDSEFEDLKKLGFQSRYIISEILPLKQIKDPLKIEISKKDDKRRTKDSE